MRKFLVAICDPNEPYCFWDFQPTYEDACKLASEYVENLIASGDLSKETRLKVFTAKEARKLMKVSA